MEKTQKKAQARDFIGGGSALNKDAELICSEIKKVIIGKNETIEKVLMAILAGGHVLIEDVPGVGKTTLALAFSKVLGLDGRRIQFTPDTVASDITGYSAYDREANGFVYRPGAVMTNILLADEINRTSGKTQSALLEVMEEGACTVDGITHEVPKPFSVLATQNPVGSAGTSMLPASQLDRFIIKLSMGYPDKESMKNILKDRHHENPLDNAKTVSNAESLIKMQKKAAETFVDESVYDYISELAEETRKSEYVTLGVSPRGALALCRMAKAKAFCSGREYAVPQDVRDLFTDVFAHRLVLSTKAKICEISAENVLNGIIESVKCPENRYGK